MHAGHFGSLGAHKATAAERAALDGMSGLEPRAFSSLTGHLKEAQFPFAVALAALAAFKKSAYPAFDQQAETAFAGSTDAVLATTVGYHQFEGMALVHAAD